MQIPALKLFVSHEKETIKGRKSCSAYHVTCISKIADNASQ